jgi:SEL1 protein
LDEVPTVAAGSAPEEDLVFEDDGPWYMGKARDEFNRRMRDAAVPGDDEDPVQVHNLSICLFLPRLTFRAQWARDRRNAEADRDSDFGPEDMFDAALRGGHRGDVDVDGDGDEFAETMILVVLCLIVSLLLYIRGRWVERLRREEQQQRRQLEQREEEREDNGLFPPPPGEPEPEPAARDNDWAEAR